MPLLIKLLANHRPHVPSRTSRNLKFGVTLSEGTPMGVANRNRVPPVLLAMLCLLLNCATSTFAGPETSEETLDKRRQAIAKLNDSQRQEVIRKYDAYRQLSESERDHLRTLHKDIEADVDLKETMRQYCEWLKNLDVTQRELLRQAKTPEQKRDLVVRIKNEQLHQKNDLWRDNGPVPPERKAFSPLTSEGLKSVMTVLETETTKTGGIISKERQAELEKLHGTQRYKLLMRTLGEYTHPKDASIRHWEIPDAVVNALAEKIENPEIKQKLRTALRNRDNFPFAKRLVFGGLLESTQAEARREFNGPEADELKENLFKSLSPEFQNHYSQLPLWQQDLVLMGIHRDEIWRAFATAGDFPTGPPGERGQPNGRGMGQYLIQKGRPRDGERSGDRSPPNGNRPFRGPAFQGERPPENGRRPPPERKRDGEDKP